MKQLKNEVSILTGTKSSIGKLKTLQLAGNGAERVGWNMSEVHGNSMVDKRRRHPLFIKAQPRNSENSEAMVTQPTMPSFIDIAGTAILVGVILTILISLIFFGNGIHIAKPIFR